MDHLAEAKRIAHEASSAYPKIDKVEWVQVATTLAFTHATIALVELLAERLPPPAETASECQERLKKEESDE